MTLSVLEGHSLLQAFLSAIFRICGVSRGPSASAELLVIMCLMLILIAIRSLDRNVNKFNCSYTPVLLLHVADADENNRL